MAQLNKITLQNGKTGKVISQFLRTMRLNSVRAPIGPASFFAVSLAIGGLIFTAPAWAENETPGADSGAYQRLKVSTGLDYSSGAYGGTLDTEILFIPLSVEYETATWRVKATLPYISIEGPGGVTGGPDGPIIIGPGDPNAVTKQSGMGDVVLQASYLFAPSSSDLPYLEVTARVKLPTASENKGLGTGKTDYFIQADVFKTVGNFTPFGTIGYRIAGDPAGFDLNNTAYASAGLGYKFSPGLSGGVIVDYRQKSSDFSSERLEVVPYAVIKSGGNWSLNVYGVIGLADGSPDTGIGLQISLFTD